MSVPCTALPQSYAPPTQDELFAKMQQVFSLDPHGRQGQGNIPMTAGELIRRKAIEFLSPNQRQVLALEQQAMAVHHAHTLSTWQEGVRVLPLAPPETPILDLISYQVLLVQRYLIMAVITSLSYQDRITLLYHYRNESNMLEAVRFRSRLFKRIREFCS